MLHNMDSMPLSPAAIGWGVIFTIAGLKGGTFDGDNPWKWFCIPFNATPVYLRELLEPEVMLVAIVCIDETWVQKLRGKQ